MKKKVAQYISWQEVLAFFLKKNQTIFPAFFLKKKFQMYNAKILLVSFLSVLGQRSQKLNRSPVFHPGREGQMNFPLPTFLSILPFTSCLVDSKPEVMSFPSPPCAKSECFSNLGTFKMCGRQLSEFPQPRILGVEVHPS